MPKWIQLPSEPLRYNPYQTAFWGAIEQRVCPKCGLEFKCPPSPVCPACQDVKGTRKYHRLLLCAGRRGGKTRAASIAAVKEATIPNSIVWCCAPTNPKLHRYVIPALQQLIPPEWVASWSSEFLDLRLTNGSLIHMQTLEDPDQGRGQGVDALWLDEASELSEKHWDVIRPSLTERRGVAILSTSPRSYDWVYENFYHRAEEGVPGYWACRYSTSENPIISSEEIADAKATMSDTMFRQEYEADFVTFTGAVYGSSVDSQILRTDAQIKEVLPEWPDIAPWRQVLVGLDTGADHPFGAVKVVSSERGLVVVGEYLERHRSFMQHAQDIKTLASSPTAKYHLNKNERQGMIELGQHGIYCQGSENDVIAGTERVKSWLQAKQLWFVESLCPKTIKQHKAYRWAEDKAKDGSVRKEKVYKLNDELADALRYLCMGFPTLPKPKVETGGLRDLSKLDEKTRWDIEQMRRVEDKLKKPEVASSDFWG